MGHVVKTIAIASFNTLQDKKGVCLNVVVDL